MHDRYPVIEHAQSHRVLGFVHLKQLWHYATPDNRKQMRVKSLIQQTEQVLLVTDVVKLLRLLIDDRRKMLIVVDVTGQALGIITLTDIMSRMLGMTLNQSDTSKTQ
jgi:CBS domain containing-hemolysin-like protein